MDGCKMIYNQQRLQSFLDGDRIMPVTIDMGIHKSCNIKCAYCYGIKQGKSPEYIREDRLKLLAEDACKAGIRSIAIVGDGEPTMNKGLYSFVEALHEKSIDCAVATNGLLIKKNEMDILTKCCTWLRFNISGVDKYDKIMGAPKDSLYELEDRVKAAVANKQGCTIGLQAVLIPEGFSEIIPLAEKALEWGVDYLVIKQFSDGGEGMPIHFDMDEYQKAVKDLKYIESLSTDKIQIIIKWKAMCDSANITKNKKWEFDSCIDLPFLFQISGDGGCYPCGYLFGNKEYCYGNVNEERLINILNSEKYWNMIKKVAETPLEKLCTGQCRHMEGLKFLNKLTKIYRGNLESSLIEMCGGFINYKQIMNNPPEHINFL
jgi:MoaA/NifB/PqqE/SkfB family radical SAM enzyme